jgi:hypothetical protein
MDPRLAQYVAINPTFNCTEAVVELLLKKFALFGVGIDATQIVAFSVPSVTNTNASSISQLKTLGMAPGDQLFFNFQIEGNPNVWFCAAQVAADFASNSVDAVRKAFDDIYPDGSGDMRATAAIVSLAAVQSTLQITLNNLS